VKRNYYLHDKGKTVIVHEHKAILPAGED
jgi:hypothetical protein